MLFYFIISVVILQRVIELIIAKRNEKWLLANGAIEYGKEHYKFIVLLHSCFFVSMVAEYNIRGSYVKFDIINYLFLVFFVILQISRIWVLLSLGKYWNTKILRIPGSELVRKGPYKLFKHPNYIIVVFEIFTIPMMFDLYFTAIIFSILNALVLSRRIKVENEVLTN
ncbi:MAG: hypothetical protein M3R36_14375 [Bacteroidota bacterium]|nr:hypothetical protein [Bacteroidota bacterium]